MRKFILASVLALAALSASISTAEAQIFGRGGGIFQNAYNRAPYYNMNNSTGAYFGSGRYNNSYYNNPAVLNNNGAPYYGGPSVYYGNSSYATPYYNNFNATYATPYRFGWRR